jgi:hypothetical protein
MMNTKNLMTGVVLTGALLVSASVAKANAYMELISGATTVQVEPGGVLVHSGPFSVNFYSQVGNGAVFVGTVGSWSVDIASGAQSGNLGNPQHSLNVTLTDNINGGTTQTHGLELIYSSGDYNLGTMANPGHYDWGASDSGGNSLTSTMTGYYNRTGIFTGGSLAGYESHSVSLEPSSPVSTPPGAPLDPAGPWVLPATFAANYQNVNVPIYGNDAITEIMLFGGTTGTIKSQKVTLNVSESFTPYVPPGVVPDGGMTATMVGAALLGLVGLRSKFGGKRA